MTEPRTVAIDLGDEGVEICTVVNLFAAHRYAAALSEQYGVAVLYAHAFSGAKTLGIYKNGERSYDA